MICDYQYQSDEDLARLSLSKEEAFCELINRYEKRLTLYILRLSNIKQEDAEDILQEVFVKAYKNLNSFDVALKFSSWIYRITHNETISFFRKNKVNFNVVNIEDNGLENMLQNCFDFKKDLHDKELILEVKNILTKMDSKYRYVLILKYIEDKDYNEISDILKIPIGTVGTLMNRGKKEFRNIAERNGIRNL
ncbi:hypothetical protein A2335_03330 [Candidatus Peregrinibacteria bacterium RIFOXYB2_FULL_32_7]|nr:MAG: hypothetical protein A2335_03330 [Candidatus Peregrinibacteria bacterium RIFOXYB2_FULL_32_7]